MMSGLPATRAARMWVAEAVSLPIHILPLHPVVIQTGFTDSHHPGMASQLNQFID
jgi:hypothetical protein